MRDLTAVSLQLLLLLLLLFDNIDIYECFYDRINHNYYHRQHHKHYLWKNPSLISNRYRFEADYNDNDIKYIKNIDRCQHINKCSSSPEPSSLLSTTSSTTSSLSEAATGTLSSPSLSSEYNQRLQQHHHFIRPLGGYERLLSRTCPDSKAVALSHVAGYIMNTVIDSNLLHSAMVYVVER